MEPYVPQTLPIETIDWIRHVPLIGKANRALARYDGILKGIVHPEILLSPLTMRGSRTIFTNRRYTGIP